MLTAAITLVAGAAIFGYVNSQAGTASQAYGQQVGNSIQYLEEKFTVIDMSWTSSTSVTIWIYNTGNIQLSLLQVRIYDSAGLVNLLYNYSSASGSTVNRVFDLKSTSSDHCGISASGYESPGLTGSGSFADPISYTGTIQLTIPSAATGCPSYGQTFNSGTTYLVDVVGLYGNSYTYSQVD